MNPPRQTYTVKIASLTRELPLFQVAPKLKIAVLNMLGDTELVEACASNLAEKLSVYDYDILVTPEAKSIPLAHAMSVETKKPYVVLRKAYKPYMGVALMSETLSITTGHHQTLYLDEKDQQVLKGKRVVILDDVVSTGSTLQGMHDLMEKAGAEIVTNAAVFTEGDETDWSHILALGNLPLFKVE
jgi:adenine phosphoribosyltransferase